MKRTNPIQGLSYPPKLKHVKRARSWCVTYCENSKQKQEWFSDKEKAEVFIKSLN